MAGTTEESADTKAIRPIRVEIPEAEIEGLRARIAATRWPETEAVADQSQGVQLATIQALARYWATDYDFRRFEARLNAFNMPGTVPLDVSKALTSNVFGTGDSRPADLSADESRAYEQLSFLFTKGIGYALGMGLRPQTLYGLADSPIALAAWMLDHDARSYDDISQAPAAVSVFPRELYQAPRSWAEKAYPNLIYFNEVDTGNHFAAWQEPEILTTEGRAAFRSLR
jgi:Epoxide hydrolase N terminus